MKEKTKNKKRRNKQTNKQWGFLCTIQP